MRYAAYNGHLDVVRFLLQVGANPAAIKNIPIPIFIEQNQRIQELEKERIYLYARILALEQARGRGEIGALDQALHECLDS